MRTLSVYSDLVAAFETRFITGKPRFLDLDALAKGKQGTTETVDDYIYFVQKKRAKRIYKTPSWLDSDLRSGPSSGVKKPKPSTN